MTQETLTGSTDLRSSDLKTYAYDAYGKRVSMTDDPTSGANKTYTYGHDVHGQGDLRLRRLRREDSRTTAGDAGGADQLNPYRYGAWRFDTGSGTLDMGARRFSPNTANFLQADAYQGALANLGLSMDPMTGDRYALAAGNPVGFIEVDGHMLAKSGPGACTATRNTQRVEEHGLGRPHSRRGVGYGHHGQPTPKITEECVGSRPRPVVQGGAVPYSDCTRFGRSVGSRSRLRGELLWLNGRAEAWY